MPTTHIDVTLAPDRVNFPLRPVYVGQGSALKLRLLGLPDGSAAKLILTPVDGSPAQAYSSTALEDGTVEVYLPGWAFPDEGLTTYEINAYEGEGDDAITRWLGRGALSVLAANTSAEVPEAPAFPDGSYYWNPVTRLYYRVSVEIDPDTARMTLAVSQEGVTHVP